MPGFPRPPSYASITISQTELGPFQKFLDEPSPRKLKKIRRKLEMPARRQSEDVPQWGRLAWQVVEIFCAETVGTGMLLFFGCMGLVAWQKGEDLHPFQGAIVFSVVVATIIQIFGHISAAHLNPAVTIAFMMLGQITPAMAVVYVLSECIGAILGFGLLMAVAMEFLATCFLVLVVCACTDPRNADKADSSPLKFGFCILALCLAVGPYTGASMNPARTLGPALWNGNWTQHWVYWLGPCLSGFFTAIFYQAMFNRRPVKETSYVEEVPLHQVKSSNTQRSMRAESSR